MNDKSIKNQYRLVCGALRRLLTDDSGLSCEEEAAYANNRYRQHLCDEYPRVYRQAHITVMGYQDFIDPEDRFWDFEAIPF